MISLNETFETEIYNSSCRSESCWDVNKCSSLGNFRVHMDIISQFNVAGSSQILNNPSIEFYELYKWIKSSSYFTNNEQEACIRLPAVDFLAYSKTQDPMDQALLGQQMQQEDTWRNGINNVFFNFIPPISAKNGLATGFQALPIGNSLIASASLRHSTLRFGFDVPIPYYSKAIEKFKNGGERIEINNS